MRMLSKFIHGEVRLQISGRHAERFFQLCAHNDIEIRDLECTGTDCFCCTMTKNDVWTSRPYYRKTGVRCRILQKNGLPFLLFRYRKRILFPFALCLVIYLFGYCSRFIWRVEITGNTYLTEEYLLSYLEEKNAAPGAKKSAVDCDVLALALREDFDEIIWASAAVEGTVLQIQLQEKTDAQQFEEELSEEEPAENDAEPHSQEQLKDDRETAGILENTESAENDYADSYVLAASKDAVVESIMTRRGMASVKAGDTVLAGDILVEGTQEVLDDDGATKFWYVTKPDADIIGIVTYSYTDTISETWTKKTYGSSFVSSFYIQLSGRRFSIDLPVSTDENTEQLENYYQFHITGQFYLPFGIGTICSIPVLETEETLTKEEALESANEHLQKYLEGLQEGGTEILEQELIMTKVDGAYKVEGVITARESIGILCTVTDYERNLGG